MPSDALPKVLVDPHFRSMDEIFSPADRERLQATCEVLWGKDDPMPVDAARQAMDEATVVICSGWRYGAAPPPSVRAVIDVSGGFPTTLDYATCMERGIRVLSAAPAFGPQVAEMALGMAIAGARGIVTGDRDMRAGTEQWLHAGNSASFSLFGGRIGIIGYGGIARALRPLLAPFGCRIGVYDPWLADGYLRTCGLEPLSLEELLRTSRITFVLAVPSRENTALLSRERLELVPNDAVLVLVSRAHVVDFEALTDLVLAERFTAAVDVFPVEPLDPDHRIRTANRAILSAHRAGSVPDGLREIGAMVLDDLEAMVRGLPPQRLQRAEPELIPRRVRI